MVKYIRILIYIIYPLLFLGLMIFCFQTFGEDEKSIAGRQEARLGDASLVAG